MRVNSSFSVRRYPDPTESITALSSPGISFSESQGCGLALAPERLSFRYVTEGRSSYEFARGQVVTQAGEGAIVPARSEIYCATRTCQPTHGISFYFDREDIPERFDTLLTGTHPIASKILSRMMADVIGETARLGAVEWRERVAEYRLLAGKALDIILEELGQKADELDRLDCARQSHRHRLLAQIDHARDLLASSEVAAKNLDCVAEKVGLSRSHFTRLFRRATGITPKHYLDQARMRRAHAMLVEADIRTVATQLGYADAPTFSKAFKRITGMPPNLVRRS